MFLRPHMAGVNALIKQKVTAMHPKSPLETLAFVLALPVYGIAIAWVCVVTAFTELFVAAVAAIMAMCVFASLHGMDTTVAVMTGMGYFSGLALCFNWISGKCTMAQQRWASLSPAPAPDAKAAEGEEGNPLI